MLFLLKISPIITHISISTRYGSCILDLLLLDVLFLLELCIVIGCCGSDSIDIFSPCRSIIIIRRL